MRAKVKGRKATRLSQQVSYRWPFPERTLHVVDIENLAGAAIPTLVQVNEVQDWYLTRLGFGVADQAVLASSHLGLINTALGWPHARYRVRSGLQRRRPRVDRCAGAREVARRFSHVVIGSGDGMFGRRRTAWPTEGCGSPW